MIKSTFRENAVLSIFFLGPAINSILSYKINYMFLALFLCFVFFSKGIVNFKGIDKRLLSYLSIVIGSSAIYLFVHLNYNDINFDRYITYLTIGFIGSAVFYFSYICIEGIEVKGRGEYFYFPIFLFVVFFVFEFYYGVGYSNLPIKHLYSALHANINDQSLSLLILCSVVSITNSRDNKVIFFLFFVCIGYAYYVGSRLIILFTIVQFLLLVFYKLIGRRMFLWSVMLSFFTLAIITIGALSLYDVGIFLDDFSYQVFLTKSTYSSIEMRVFLLLESFRTAADMSLVEYLFGLGFGQDNFINPFNTGQEYYNLHNTYMEFFINGGVFIYMCFLLVATVFRVDYSSFIINILLYSPVFLSVVSISSAVYYPQFYVLMAAVVLYSKHRGVS